MFLPISPELSDKIYYHSLFSCAVGLLVIAICFCVQGLPRKSNPKYWLARKLLGIVAFLYALQCFSYLFFDLRDYNAHLATAISISIYYLSGLVYEIAFLPMMRPGIHVRPIIIRNATEWGIYVALQMVGLSFFPEYGHIITLIACAWFFIGALRITHKIFSTYYIVWKTTKEVSIRDIHPEIGWIFRAAFAMIAWGLFCGIAPNMGKAFIGIFSFIGIFVYLYMYISFNKYMLVMKQTIPVLLEAEQIAEEAERMLQEAEGSTISGQSIALFNQWLADKNFLKEDISITDLANAIGTNRSYLSQYINRTYGCSFRTCINRSRIQEACEYIKANPEATIDKVAAHCGYSSVSYFSTVFKQETGVVFSKYQPAV